MPQIENFCFRKWRCLAVFFYVNGWAKVPNVTGASIKLLAVPQKVHILI